MNHVRSLVAADTPALAALHASVFAENSDLGTARIHWTRPLRPTRYVWSLAVERSVMPPIASVAGPLCSALDSLITRTARSRVSPP